MQQCSKEDETAAGAGEGALKKRDHDAGSGGMLRVEIRAMSRIVTELHFPSYRFMKIDAEIYSDRMMVRANKLLS